MNVKVIIEDVLKIPECVSLKIIAGNKGIGNKINWTTAIETVEIIRFANKGDLNLLQKIEGL